MPSLFRKKQTSIAPLMDAAEVLAFVPASARPSDAGRLETAFAPEDDGGEADMAFLASLVESVDKPATRRPSTQMGAPEYAPARPVDALNVFREATVERYEPKPWLFAAIPDAGIDDLVEDLAITAAALRARKAA
jgi:hypothetical protein